MVRRKGEHFVTFNLLLVLVHVFTWYTLTQCETTSSTTTTTSSSSEIDQVYDSCIRKAREDIFDCDDDWRERKKDDLDDREECCAFVEYRNCVKEAIEDACEDRYPEEVWERIVYAKWRNETNRKYPRLNTRCWDDASDSFECIFLNHMGLMVTMLTLTIIFLVLWCFLTVWLFYSRGTWQRTLDLRHD